MPESPRERLLLGAMLLLFVALNLATGSLSPTVWMDEVMYADPAVNFVRDGRFVSTAWYQQTGDAFWAGNVPLHEVLLIPWISAFGVSPLAVRSINYVLAALGAALLWWAAARQQAPATPAGRLALVALALLGNGIAFSYRSGRPDMAGFALLAALFLAATVTAAERRRPALLLIGALLPVAGLHYLAYLCLVAGASRLFLRTSVIDLAMPLAGAACGLAGLAVLYASQGVAGDFVASVTHHMAGGAELGQRLLGVFGAYGADKSYLALLPVILVALWLGWPGMESHRRPLAAAAIAVALAVPGVLHVLGKFPIYYGWMAYLPLVFACVLLAEGQGGRGVFAAVGLLVLATGLPPRLGLAALERANRDYAPVEAFVARQLGPADVAYVSFAAYYPAKRSAGRVYFPPHAPMLREEDKRAVTVLILIAPDIPAARDVFGTGWRRIAALTSVTPASSWLRDVMPFRLAPLYDLAVYRRARAEGGAVERLE